MNYGHFDDANREYIITDPRTPTKWINYIGTLKFGGFVDHTGGALLCKNDPTFNRITKYVQQMPASDFKGETLYLRIPSIIQGAGPAKTKRATTMFSRLSSFPRLTRTTSSNVMSGWVIRASSVSSMASERKRPSLFPLAHTA